MGAIHVHEFMSLDGVIDAPTWTFDCGFDPKMGDTLAALGSGPRLFPDDAPVKLSLAASATYDNGVVHLAYRPQAS